MRVRDSAAGPRTRAGRIARARSTHSGSAVRPLVAGGKPVPSLDRWALPSRLPGQYPGSETGMGASSIWEMSGPTTPALAEDSPATHTPNHLAEKAGDLSVLEGAPARVAL